MSGPQTIGRPGVLDGSRASASTTGGDKTYDGFKTGTFNSAYLRTPLTSWRRRTPSTRISEISHGGGLILLNMGVTVTCAGGNPSRGAPASPTADQDTRHAERQVRQAIQAAIDPKAIDNRAIRARVPGSALLQSDFRWDPVCRREVRR